MTSVIAKRFPDFVLVADRGDRRPYVAIAVRGIKLGLFPSHEVPHVVLVFRRRDLLCNRSIRLTRIELVESLLYPRGILLVQSTFLQFSIQRGYSVGNKRASVRPQAQQFIIVQVSVACGEVGEVHVAERSQIQPRFRNSEKYDITVQNGAR